MDMDMSMSADGDLMQYFDLSPDQFPWRAPRPQEIEVRRAHMSDMLVFDILLSSGGIRHPDTLFPPTDPDSLERLLEAITHSTYDVLKQDCLVYFLLKWHQDGREEEFKEKRGIPPQFASLADAYWHLDSGVNVGRAVSLLSDARLNRDYPSKILQALSLSDDASAYIRAYVRTANPLLTEPDDIDAYTIALAESSLMEAWSYQRSFSEVSATRKRLIRKILDWCITPQPRLAPLTHLLAFPFSPYEQNLVHSYALDPPSHVPAASVAVIQDLVCVRLVQSGQHAAAIKLDRQFSSVPRGGDKAQKIAQERRQMMDELMSAMPNAERYLLELELENFAQGRGMNLSESVSSAKPKAKGKGVDLSMSWEHIAPPAVTNGATSAPAAPASLPIPQRSNAPRFGGVRPPNGAPLTRQHAVIMPKPPSGPLLFAGIPAGNIPSSAGMFGSATANTSVDRGGSLFDVAGSANSAPNAFYQPPASTGQKRSMFGTLSASTSARPQPTSAFAALSAQASAQHKNSGDPADTSISFHGPHDADVSMLSELSEPESGADASLSRAEPGAEEEEEVSHAGFAASVFGNVPSAHTRPIATSTGSRIARTETEARMPPGAFLPDDDEHDRAVQETQEEQEQASVSAARARGGRSTRASASASASTSTRARARAPRSRSPEQQSSHAPALSTRTRRAVRDADLGRSIPGSLMGDDDEDDNDEDDDRRRHGHGQDGEEEEDVIAPLPAPTPARRTSRKARASNGSQVEAPRVTRRSSRLSAVSSVGSSSPEPVSPQKISAKSRSARGGRTSTTAGASASAAKSTAAKSTSRKKRT
ncbi:hypothetical protein TRAPUB_975 [Trametes pubescens]|uniref:ELYS-like domain-containing protein n=1 Tax=Trametes pubescens TaxID=154538 RepID=A0A1M2VKM4_TRAPU|nr:hypothetical protein TRAPUB_975 [Trametes pubescens]